MTDQWPWKGNYLDICVINVGLGWIEVICFGYSPTGVGWPQRTHKMP